MSQTEKDIAAIKAFYAVASENKIPENGHLLHPNIVMTAPFAPDVLKAGYPDKFEGKEAAVAWFQTLSTLVAPLNIQNLDIEALQKPGEFVVTFSSDTKMLASDLPYRNRYIVRVGVKDGLIAKHEEYYDAMAIISALGGSVVMPPPPAEA